MNQRNISNYECFLIADFAAGKYSYIENDELRAQAVFDFVQTYIDGGRFVVYNSRNQFLADFDVLDDAIYYKKENEPKNELFSIECEILN
jgi:hypothetical protein